MQRRFACFWQFCRFWCCCAPARRQRQQERSRIRWAAIRLRQAIRKRHDHRWDEPYSYRYSTFGSGYSVKISYPDGESYTWPENVSSGTGSASMEFDFAKYPSGMELNGALSRTHPHVQKESGRGDPRAAVCRCVQRLRGRRGAWYLEPGWTVPRRRARSDAAHRVDPPLQAACWTPEARAVMKVIAPLHGAVQNRRDGRPMVAPYV